jgi:hypothetical protein
MEKEEKIHPMVDLAWSFDVFFVPLMLFLVQLAQAMAAKNSGVNMNKLK